MKVLVACEFSGIVRDAFIAQGHDAWSCDIIETEKEGPHYQGNVLDILDDNWDLMIAHPPCTHIASSGAVYFKEKRKDGRQQEGIDFFMSLVEVNISSIAIENPVGIMSTVFRKPDQIIQPYEYGDTFSKRTCLWLKNLPLLQGTKLVSKEEHVTWYSDAFRLPKVERQKVRSRTFKGIAEAMASQWSNI